MFKPNKTAARAPALSPFLKFEEGGVLTYVENLGSSNGTTRSACLAIIFVLVKAASQGKDAELKNACLMMFEKNSVDKAVKFFKKYGGRMSDDEDSQGEEEDDKGVEGGRERVPDVPTEVDDDENLPEGQARESDKKKKSASTGSPESGNLKDDDISDEDKECIMSAIRQEPSATQWIVDLSTASKKKPLEGSNVEGYYASFGRTDIKGKPIATLINKASNYLKDMMSDSEFRGALSNTVFMAYHTSRVSTGKILYDMIDDFVQLKILETDDDNYKKIVESKNNPHDIVLSKEIPQKFIAYASIFLEAAGKDVGNWYQGEKAVSELPAAQAKGIKAIFKKYLEIRNDVDKIEDAETLNDLIENRPDHIF